MIAFNEVPTFELSVNSVAKTIEMNPVLISQELICSTARNRTISAVKKMQVAFADGDVIRLKTFGDNTSAKVCIVGTLYKTEGGM